jgi:hypothetical protein
MTKKNELTKKDGLVKRDDSMAEITDDELHKLFDTDENMKGTNPRLPDIEILHQAQKFTLPDGSVVSEIKGVIIDSNRCNAYWKTSFADGGSGNLPDCFSYNGEKPHSENPLNPDCTECMENRYGTDGRGKSCKNVRRVHILIDGNRIPFRLTLPPTSLKSWDAYMVVISNVDRPYPTIITKLTLEETQNKDKVKYSVVRFELVNNINEKENLLKIHKLKEQMKLQMQREEIVVDEVGEKPKSSESDSENSESDPF